MKNSRKGFTLLEVLIAVTILTALITMSFFSASSMKATARANKVINDMIAWKMAAIAWYNAHRDEVNTDGTLRGEKIEGNDLYYNGNYFNVEVAKYLANVSDKEVYSNSNKPKNNNVFNVFKMKYAKNRWFVCYNIPPDPTILKQLMTKLKSRAKNFGIIKNTNPKNKNDLYKDNNLYDGTQDYLYLEVLDFNE